MSKYIRNFNQPFRSLNFDEKNSLLFEQNATLLQKGRFIFVNRGGDSCAAGEAMFKTDKSTDLGSERGSFYYGLASRFLSACLQQILILSRI